MEMRKVVLDENVIPPMTHPWGKAWKQPDRNNLVLDDKYVMMYRRDFEMLPVRCRMSFSFSGSW